MTEIQVTQQMITEAREYANKSINKSSSFRDRLFEGALGEIAFREWLLLNRINFKTCNSYGVSDDYDFKIAGYTVDVKSRMKSTHKNNLVSINQVKENPKEIYVFLQFVNGLNPTFRILGGISNKRMGRLPQRFFGQKTNHYAKDYELTNIYQIISYILNNPKRNF